MRDFVLIKAEFGSGFRQALLSDIGTRQSVMTWMTKATARAATSPKVHRAATVESSPAPLDDCLP